MNPGSDDTQAVLAGVLTAGQAGRLAGELDPVTARAVTTALARGDALPYDGLIGLLATSAAAVERSQRLKSITEELRAANERLKELDQLKDEFVSMVSHELRTPLTSIRAFGEILLNNPEMDADQRREFLEVVVRESERLTRLINQVLDLSKIESGSAQWQLEDVDLSRLAREATEATQQLFTERQTQLHIEIDSDDNAIKGDPDRLTQLIINLLANASKFTEPGEGEVWLRLAPAPGDTLRLSVTDNGPGISQEDQRRIFDKFHQVSFQQAGKPKGSGLGLTICRLIAEAHWGTLWVESEPGQGASFICELPRAGGEHCNVTGYVELGTEPPRAPALRQGDQGG
ncbi:MAG: sensor histidine kinase [Halorhodospira sp.]